jgi:hypothetical protein
MKTTWTRAILCAALAGLLAWSSPTLAEQKGAKGAPAATLAAGQFATEAEAKASCPTDTVVWVNLTSKIYHPGTSKVYGKTKRGAYMCEKEAAAGGFRAAKAPRGKKKKAA